MTNPTPTEPPSSSAAPPKKPQWPAHNAPRVWFLTDGLAPVAIALSRHLLEHGDYVVAGILPTEFDSSRGDELREFMGEVAREGGSGAASRDEMEVDEDEDGEDDEQGSGDDGDGATNERSANGRGRNGKTKAPRKRWRERFKLVGIDGRSVGQCQSAIADALVAFDRIDILVICRSEALIGTIEELHQSSRAEALVKDQFETNFFAPVNIIRALLPSMREKRNGHIIVLTGISAHLGTPGLAMYCSSQWAIEGYCDSLSYEIAPFNIKMTIVQPNIEIPMLTNKITSAPPMPEYSPDVNGAPLSRELVSGLLDKLDGDQGLPPIPETPTGGDLTSPAASGITAATPGSEEGQTPSLTRTITSSSQPGQVSAVLTQGDLLHASTVTSLFPNLPNGMKQALVAETVFAIAAVGGHDNPPSRHIVGYEGVASVKEKLKTISEELEDFLGVSGAVDIGDGKMEVEER